MTHEMREELADDGSATGVELENVDDQIAEPFDPDEIKVTTRTMTVDLLMGRLADDVLKLQPDFQRKAGIWSEVKQSRLIESLVLRIPLPSFYVSEDDKEEWEVVDGVQRLTAISRFVQPQSANQALRLTGLEYLKNDFDGYRFKDLPPRLGRRIRETEFTFHVIESNTPPVVRFNIFAPHQHGRHASHAPGIAPRASPGTGPRNPKAVVGRHAFPESRRLQRQIGPHGRPRNGAAVLRLLEHAQTRDVLRRDFGSF